MTIYEVDLLALTIRDILESTGVEEDKAAVRAQVLSALVVSLSLYMFLSEKEEIKSLKDSNDVSKGEIIEYLKELTQELTPWTVTSSSTVVHCDGADSGFYNDLWGDISDTVIPAFLERTVFYRRTLEEAEFDYNAHFSFTGENIKKFMEGCGFEFSRSEESAKIMDLEEFRQRRNLSLIHI